MMNNNLQVYLKRYGNHCMAYSTLQDGLEYFISDELGYIAYQSFWHPILAPFGRKLVLSDPIADKKAFKPLVEAFLAKYKYVIFVQVHEEMAQVLSDLGFLVNQLGVETHLSIQHYDTKGKYKAKVRQWYNGCQKRGIELSESNLSTDDVLAMKTLSEQWIKRKGGREYAFLTRPLTYQFEQNVRYFLAYDKRQDLEQGELLAFSVFDPIYEGNKVIGYYHNADRLSSTAPNGVGAFIILSALKQFKKENKRILSLGMSPLYQIKENYKHHSFTSKALKFAYKNFNNLYPFQGNASHKKKFGGERSRVYFSSSKGVDLRELFSILKALKLV